MKPFRTELVEAKQEAINTTRELLQNIECEKCFNKNKTKKYCFGGIGYITTTGIENEMLVGVDADEIISEFCGVRGDNAAEYDNMISKISETGSVKLADIKTSIFDKPTLLKADMYFIAMGLKTDLVSESYYSVDKIRKAMNQNH